MRDDKRNGDNLLENRLAKVDGWIKEGKIPISSRVIPVGESLPTQQWVLPTEQAIEILRNSRTFARIARTWQSRRSPRRFSPRDDGLAIPEITTALLFS
jgi:hypothetical protein